MKKTSIRILTLLVAASLSGGAYAQAASGAAGGASCGGEPPGFGITNVSAELNPPFAAAHAFC